jgi:predicted O-methyltransferase YrrM
MKNMRMHILFRFGRKNKSPLSVYTRFQLAKKYLHYYFTASNGNGHGVHSPFVFDFIENVLKDKKKYDCYAAIEAQRKKLLMDSQIIEVEDFGAGSSIIKSNKRAVKNIAASSLKPKKYAQLLYRIAQYYNSETIIELGTSLGITASYLASGNNSFKVYTCEGSTAIVAIAQQNFDILKLKNIELVQGDFNQTLQPLLSKINKIDLAFVDGNHRKEPSLAYFSQLLNHSTNASILIFDDIHWSAEMEAAWKEIQSHPRVTLTIDLFFIGIVFIHNDFKVKQHFSVAY